MMLLYFGAPWVLPQKLALLVPGLLYGVRNEKFRLPALVLFAFYVLASAFTPYGVYVEGALSLGVLWLWWRHTDRRILLRPLLILTATALATFFVAGAAFSAHSLSRAANGLIGTLVFVFSEELFLRKILRPELPAGPYGALATGLLWGLWHAPLYLTGFYVLTQALRGAAISLLIDAFYDEGGIVTAVAVHALHNALLVPFDGSAVCLSHHLLFFLLVAVGTVVSRNFRYGKGRRL